MISPLSLVLGPDHGDVGALARRPRRGRRAVSGHRPHPPRRVPRPPRACRTRSCSRDSRRPDRSALELTSPSGEDVDDRPRRRTDRDPRDGRRLGARRRAARPRRLGGAPAGRGPGRRERDRARPRVPLRTTSGTIRTGMSGFSYPEWIGEIYPAGHEAQRTCSRRTRRSSPPSRSTCRSVATRCRRRSTSGATRCPDGFHVRDEGEPAHHDVKRLVDTKDDVAEIVTTCIAGCRDTSARSCSSSIRTRSSTRRSSTRSARTSSPGLRYALEPRHESFMTAEAHEMLRRNGLVAVPERLLLRAA